MGKGYRTGAEGSIAAYAHLEEIVRHKIQEFIQELLEEEVEALLGRKKHKRRCLVDGTVGYRNGYGKARRISLLAGTIEMRRPRVRNLEERFESRILPLFKRRSREVGDLLPELYLHGLSKGDFELALRGVLGDGAPLSASSIQRLKGKWEAEYKAWQAEDLSDLEPVYIWADGIYVKAGIGKDKAALLVVFAAMRDGTKRLLAVESGYRESIASWSSVLRSLKSRGLCLPRLLVADGHLGIWGALGEIYPETKEQRCWNHKIMNVLDRLPKTAQAQAREHLCGIPYAETRAECERLRDRFNKLFGRDYPKATEILENDWDAMVTFYEFPKEHWVHLRTTNVVESPFASVRLRTTAAKRFRNVTNATALIWKVLTVAEKRFRRLKASHLLPEVYKGVEFKDGERLTIAHERRLAA